MQHEAKTAKKERGVDTLKNEGRCSAGLARLQLHYVVDALKNEGRCSAAYLHRHRLDVFTLRNMSRCS